MGDPNPLISSSPLHIALDNLEIVKLLIHNGADVNCRETSYGNTPLHATKSPEIVELLVQHGADPLKKWGVNGQSVLTPLFLTAQGKNDENLLRKHLEYGEMISENGTTTVYGCAADNIMYPWSPQIMCELEELVRTEAAKKGIRLLD